MYFDGLNTKKTNSRCILYLSTANSVHCTVHVFQSSGFKALFNKPFICLIVDWYGSKSFKIAHPVTFPRGERGGGGKGHAAQ